MNRYRSGWYGESYRHYLASKGISVNKYARKRDEDLPSQIEEGKRFMTAHIKLVPIGRIEPTESLQDKDYAKVERFKLIQDSLPPVKAFAPWATKQEAEKLGFKEKWLPDYSPNLGLNIIDPIDDKQLGPNDPESQTAEFHDPSKYVLFEGHHRLRAAMERGDKTMPVKIYKYPYQYVEKRRAAGLKVE